MRVVIASRIYSPEPSAASFMLEAVALALRDAGHQVTVLTTRAPAALTPADPTGIVVRRARVLRDSTGYVRGYLPYLSFDVPLFFRLLFTRRADAYLLEPPPTTGAVVRVATALLRRPYVYDAADVWSDAAKLATSSGFVLSMLRWVEVFAWKGARHALSISDGVSARMRELGSATPSTVIGFGVDSTVFRYEPIREPRPYFVYAGTYSEWHGAGVFLDAFALFAAGHPGHRLLFVGNGSERERLETRAAELGLQGVEFLDPVDSHALNVILNGATASLASLKPGQGYDYAFTTKLYASIAAGCPVVFSGVGPTVDFIHAHGQSHPLGAAVEYDAALVAGEMSRFATEPLPDDAREKLSSWARGAFSLSSIAESVVRIMEEVGRRGR